jgi:hypothetical protein
MSGCWKILWVVILLCSFNSVHGQEEEQEAKPKRVTVNGYLKFLQTVQFEKVDENWSTDNIVHNRLNFKWYASHSFTFTAEWRTRLFYGETVKSFPQYPELIDRNTGYVADLSAIISRGNSYFIHSVLDRVNLDWSADKWQVRVGRQRINWGQSFVWNPNDIFNAYSFFDFDYEERPGSDALLIRYHTGATSSVEVATAFASDFDDYKIAAMYRWNRSNYDYQILTGKVGADYALGFGWSGQIKTAGFKGEVTWLEPFDEFLSGETTLVASLSADYTFGNSWFVHSEVIYNSFPNGGNALPGAGINFLTESRSPKTLTLTELSWFNEASYQISPLLKAGLYSIYNPTEGSIFIGPNAELSISENVYLLFMGQFFVGPSTSMYGSLGYFNYLRLKWSF